MIGDRCLRVAHHAFILFLVVATVAVLSAQTVVDPRFVEFSPSANHNTNDTDGTPLVQRYSLSVYPVGSSAAFDTMDLGKPTPSGGVIRVDFLPLLHSVPTPGVMFEARVTAIGPGGSTTSSLSNQFSFQGACTYTLSPGTLAMPVAGGPGLTDVLAPAGCAWTAVSNNTGWLTVTSGASGSGNGTVGFSVAANTGAARTGTVAIGGQTFTVNQAAAPCTYTLSPGSLAVAAAGTSGNVGVAAGAGCAWTAVSNNTGWLTVTSGANGSGNGTVGFSVAANTGAARTGTVAIGGRTFTVNQAAAPCTYTLSPGSQAVAAAGTSGNVSVAAGAGCNWSATSSAGWITLTGTTTSSGNGSVAYSVAANTGAARTGTVAIGGQTFTVNQAAAPCTYTLSPGSLAVAAAGTSGNVSVAAGAGCNWSATSSAGWITLTGTTTSSGNGSVAYSVAANTGAARTGTVAIGGQTFTVNQAAAPCTYTLSPGSLAAAAAGTSGNVSVAAGAGCNWSATSSAGWITLTGTTTSSGNGSVAYSVAANTGAARTGTVAIGGQTFTVNQAAAPCTYTLSPGSLAAAAAGTSGNVSVAAGAGCNWSATSSAGWITLTGTTTSSGNGSVAYSVAANTGAARTGTVAIGGQTFTVNQAAAPCTYTLSPGSLAAAAAGTSGNVSVAAGAGCNWSATSSAGWITLTGTTTSSGNGSVAYSVAANTGAARTGTVAIGGQTFTVNQAAAPCTYTLSPGSLAAAAAGTSGNVSVAAGAGCNWSATSSAGWITLTGTTTSSGNGSVAYSVAANTGAARTGTVAIGGQTFTVNQAAAPCTYTLSPGSLAAAAAGTSGNVSVAAGAGCNWSATSSAGWITLTGTTTSSGNGSVAYSVAANTGAARTGTVAIGGQTFTVNQAAAPCTYTLSPGSLAAAAAGTSGSVGVAAGAGCNWSATSSAGWLTVTSGASGSGNGTVGFSVAANTGAARTGTLAIGGQTFTVTQNATSCTFSISPTSLEHAPFDGATGSSTVTTSDGCAWTATSDTSWITVTSGAQGTTSGQVTFTVEPNTAPSQRLGSLTIAGRTFAVTQVGDTCNYDLTPPSQSIAAGSATGSTAVAAPTGCAWTAVSNNTGWLTVTSGASGSGDGSVGFSASANPSTSPRSGTLTVGGQTFTVTQAAAGCTFAISSNSWSVAAAGGTASTTVTSGVGCAWTAVSNNSGWLTVTSGASGSGNGTVSFSANSNTTSQVRVGTATVAGKTFTVTQNASSCTFTIAPTSMQLAPFAGANGSSTVTTSNGCAWTATSNTSWITVTSGAQGTTSGQVTFTVAPSTVTSQRLGSLTIATRTFAVTQVGNTCNYTLAPANRTIGGEGGTGSITVTAASGCPWTATTSQSWISVSGTGTASGSASYTVSANTTGTSRQGTISIGTKSFTITQGVPTGSASAPVVPAGSAPVVPAGSAPVAPSGLRVKVPGSE